MDSDAVSGAQDGVVVRAAGRRHGVAEAGVPHGVPQGAKHTAQQPRGGRGGRLGAPRRTVHEGHTDRTTYGSLGPTVKLGLRTRGSRSAPV